MTSNVKLLTLPDKVEVDKHLPTGVVIYGYTHDMMRDYARANVEHHTAALRAERDTLEHHLAGAMAEVAKMDKAEARAERLAEALQRALEAVRDTLQQSYQNAGQECCGRGGMQECCGEPEPVWAPEDQAVMDKLAPIERLLTAALREHDQEVGNG